MKTYEVNLICDRCRDVVLVSAPNESVFGGEMDVEEKARVFGWSVAGDVICADCLKKEKEDK